MASRLRIALGGPMGVGKSSVGQKLAYRLVVPFSDLDEKIGDIPAIFAAGGESVFREREYQVLVELSQGDGVISLGGGTLSFERNRRCLAEWKVLVLMADPDSLAERIGLGEGRPLAGNWRELLAERMPSFESYAPFVDTSHRSELDVVADVLSRLP